MMDQNRIESLKRRYGNRVADSPRKKHGPAEWRPGEAANQRTARRR